jgi:outer membrane lipoprotein-sorting protein
MKGTKGARVKETGSRIPLAMPESLSGRAVIKLSGIDEREFKGKAAILVKGPDKVRIEIFDLFGQVAAVIVSDAYALSIFSNNDSSFFTRDGKTPLDFTADELASFLMGMSAGEQGLVEDALRRVLFDDFRDIEGLLFPFNLSLEDGKERLSVRYSSVELNPELDDALFVHILPVPPKLPKLQSTNDEG